MGSSQVCVILSWNHQFLYGPKCTGLVFVTFSSQLKKWLMVATKTAMSENLTDPACKDKIKKRFYKSWICDFYRKMKTIGTRKVLKEGNRWRMDSSRFSVVLLILAFYTTQLSDDNPE